MKISSFSQRFSICVQNRRRPALMLGAWLLLMAGQASLFSQGTGTLVRTIPNPTPAPFENFSASMAAFGKDSVLIGGPSEVYLFSTSGELLSTFSAPSPEAGGFGQALAAAGSNQVLIGAYDYTEFEENKPVQVGRAYLFNTDGTLVTTFSNPTAGAERSMVFGWSVAGVGSDRVIIGALPAFEGSSFTGSAHLFTTNGTLLHNFNNPTPEQRSDFGASVAALGSDRVLVGASSENRGAMAAGAVYLFSTNGTMLTTFTNPTPVASGNFGTAIAAVGSDRVLITAIDYGGERGGGDAYLFSTNGTLLATFRNPVAHERDYFGWSVAAVGRNGVLIGAYGDDTGAFQAGAAYLFSTNGTLLTTFNKPTPTQQDLYGISVAALGTTHVMIGAAWDDTGAIDTGAAYLYALPDAEVNNAELVKTFNNPAPASGDYFGISVAAMGNDRILIGAKDHAGSGGAAFLYSTNGALQTTFTKPSPVAGDYFGWSLASVGTEHVLIGAYGDDTGAENSGAAFLFSASGTLLTTFTNPTPAIGDQFGVSVAALGSDRVIIGGEGAGPAYLFNTNGSMLATVARPATTADDTFGSAVAALGNDRVIIGSFGDDTAAENGGAAYLFNADGTLLTILTNPTPRAGEALGWSVAPVGQDRILVGAIGDSTRPNFAGAAYLFGTNGALLMTFNNPTAAPGGKFGASVTAVGESRVLIGAYADSTGAHQSGAAYLFNTNGILLTTVTNPTPTARDWFGWSVAPFGLDRVIVGSYSEGPGQEDAGSAYLLALPYPELMISRNASLITINWSSRESGIFLYETEALGQSASWTPSDFVTTDGLTSIAQVTIAEQTATRFYRLVRQ